MSHDDLRYREAQRAHDNAAPEPENMFHCEMCGLDRYESNRAKTHSKLCCECALFQTRTDERDDALRLVADMANQVKLLRDALSDVIAPATLSEHGRAMQAAYDALKSTNPNAGLEKSVGRWDGQPKAL